jgi:hypothetical protein
MIGVGIFIATAATEKFRCRFEIETLAELRPMASARRVAHRGRRAVTALSSNFGAAWRPALASSIQR